MLGCGACFDMLTAQIPDITPLIENDRSAVRIYLVIAAIVSMVGILIAGLTFLKNIEPVQDLVLKLGGGFISTLSTVPINKFLSRKDSLRILLAVETKISMLRMQSAPSEDEIKSIYDFLWKKYESRTTS
jgi:hypothetical protein